MDYQHSNVASTITIEAKIPDEQMIEMRNMLEKVMKDNEDKNKRIEDLQNEVSKLQGKEKVEDDDPTMKVNGKDSNEIIHVGTIKIGVSYNEKQLQMLIANAVKSELTG